MLSRRYQMNQLKLSTPDTQLTEKGCVVGQAGRVGGDTTNSPTQEVSWRVGENYQVMTEKFEKDGDCDKFEVF